MFHTPVDIIIQATQSKCGSGLAREEAITSNIIVGCYGAFAMQARSHKGSASIRSPIDYRAPSLAYNLIQVAFSSVYLSNACSDLSRPLPDCLKPPNGAVMSPPSYWLTQTLPARSALAVR